MQRGQIFLYSGSGFIPWFIKKVTKSKWSHTGWVTQDVKGRDVVEANAGGVEQNPGFPYDIEKCAFLKLKVPVEQIEECLKYAEGKVGKKYDYKLFMGLFWRWIFGWKRKTEVDDWNAGYICSELVAKPVLMFCGIKFAPENVAAQNTTPEDIWGYGFQTPDKVDITYIGSKVSPLKSAA